MGILDSVGSMLGLGGEVGRTESSPWGPQQQYLKEGFAGAQDLYQQGPQQYYGGQTVAGINPNMQQYFGGMGGYSQGGVGAGQDVMGYGQQMAGGIPQAQQFYSQAMGDYFNPYASAEFQQAFDVQNPYQSQQYQDIISGSVANNPVLQSQIEMGQQDINRNMQENILPSIASGAVATGNTGSTRRGVAEGVAMRGAMEQGSDLATMMQTNAYNQALNQAGQWAGGEQFGQQAGMTGAQMGAGGEQFGQNYQMGAANQLSGMGQTGLGNIGAGYGLGSQAYQDLMGAGMYERGIEQQGLTDEQQRFDFQQNAPWENLARYQQAIQGNYGGTQTQYADPGNMMAQLALQGGGAYMMGSDRRLKTNIHKVGEIDGLNIYKWDWNEEGKEFCGNQVTKGFIYDEVPSHMQHLSLSGYGMVNYSGYEEVLH